MSEKTTPDRPASDSPAIDTGPSRRNARPANFLNQTRTLRKPAEDKPAESSTTADVDGASDAPVRKRYGGPRIRREEPEDDTSESDEKVASPSSDFSTKSRRPESTEDRPTTDDAADDDEKQPRIQPQSASKPLLQKKQGGVLNVEERTWNVGVAKALTLPIPSSQRRVLDEGLATAAQIEASTQHSGQDKADAAAQKLVLQNAPTPPWGAKDAMKATSAKVQLDLLSIPPANRKLTPLGADQASMNKTFWIENVGADGTKTRAFLCKPANDPGSEKMPSGGPRGGEVIREALAGRAAQFLFGKGIDIGMPETHVVKLNANLMPNAGQQAPEVTCSVQQHGPNQGDLSKMPAAARKNFDAKQVASIAAFDVMTLANDRHRGNLLVGPDGKTLIPIDHGENFTETSSPEARQRLKITMGGPANALLALPSAHDPMPTGVADTLKGFNPDMYAASLRADRQTISDEHADMKGMISDEAITSSARAAGFARLAAKNQPPLSAATMQVALGSHSDELLDPALDARTFQQNAQRIIQTIAKQQGAIKEICLASDADYEVLCEQVEALGWRPQRRGGQTGEDQLADPIKMLAIIKTQSKPVKLPTIQYPPELTPPDVKTMSPDMKQKREAFRAKWSAAMTDKLGQPLEQACDSLSSADGAQLLLKARQTALQRLVPVVPGNRQAEMQKRVADLASVGADKLAETSRDLSHELTELALVEQRRRFDAIETRYANQLEHYSFGNLFALPYEYASAKARVREGNVLAAEGELAELETKSQQAPFDKTALASFAKLLDQLGSQFVIPGNDPDLVGCISAMQKRQPVAAFPFLQGLATRARTFPAKTTT